MAQKVKEEKDEKEKGKQKKEELETILKKIPMDESQAFELVKKLEYLQDVQDVINQPHYFAKLYVIMFLKNYCEGDILTEHEVDFLLAMYGFLQGYDFEVDENGKKIKNKKNRRQEKYWRLANKYSDLFKNNSENLSSGSISSTLNPKFNKIVENLADKIVERIVGPMEGDIENSKSKKIGLINDVWKKFKDPEVFDAKKNKLFLPKSIFEKDNSSNDESNYAEEEVFSTSTEEFSDDTSIDEDAEDSETHSLESSSNLTDELYDMFSELRIDSNFFETIVKRLDYIPTKLEPRFRDDFYKLYIIKLIQGYCKSPNEAEFIFAVYGLLRHFERIKYKNADIRQKEYFKYAYGYNLYIQIDIYDEEEIASSLSKKFEKSLNYLTTKLAEELSNNDGKLGLVNDAMNEFDEHNNKLILPKPRMGKFKEAITNPRKRKLILFLVIFVTTLLILVLVTLCKRFPLQDKPEPNKTDSPNEPLGMNETETDESTIDDMINSIDAFMLGGVNEQSDKNDWYYESTHEETVNPDGSITTRDRKVLGHGSVTNTIKEPDTWNSSDDEVKKR